MTTLIILKSIKMNLISTVFLILLIPQILISQYIPFPQFNATWSMSVDVYDDPNDNPFIDTEEGYVHELNGDTTINGFIYQKIFERQTWRKRTIYNQLPNGDYIITNDAINYPTSESTLIGLIRQDTVSRKIYFMSLDYSPCTEPNGPFPIGEEFLLFDFDLALGDTIQLGLEPELHIIDSIDSIQYNDGIYRKIYFPSESYPEFYFIEGIGASTGLFAGVRGLFVEGEWCSLNCFKENEQYIIGNSIYNCDSIDMITHLTETYSNNEVSIYPNPFNPFLIIDTTIDQFESLQLNIYDALGQLVFKKVITSNQQYQLDTQQLLTGMYLITITNESQLIIAQKFIKTH